ncbi:MAG: asparagine synthase C-terminal domain-containing protein [bacterium]|nr:asparagine synthase C-terminal domain-containing protein [bacterium]
MDRLAGEFRHHDKGRPLAWAAECAPVRDDATGNEAIVLGPAGIRQDEIARELARHPERASEALSAFRAWGGGFAFALWEREKQSLALGCDPLGLQPLYYSESPGGLRFGGRLADTLREGEGEKLHLASCAHFLLFLSVPAGRTLLGRVRRIFPGARVRFPQNDEEDAALFPLAPPALPSRGDAAKRLLEALRGAVRAAVADLPEDAPVGLLLSGGTDSTALLALLREARKGPIAAIHVSPKDSPDRPYAREMAERYGAELLDAEITGTDARESLGWIVAAMESPGGNASAVATHRALAMAGERGVRRVLTGLGSDETFCGHAKHILAPWWPWVARLPAGLRPGGLLARAAGGSEALGRALAEEKGPEEMHRAMYGFFGKEMEAQLLGAMPKFAQIPDLPWRSAEAERFPPGYASAIFQIDLNLWLRAALAPMAGALAAAQGVELAMPFCAPEMWNLSAAMPLSWKVSGRRGKKILEEALSGTIPEEIFRRPRQGFSVPMDRWLREELKETAAEHLAPGRVARWYIANPEAIEYLHRRHTAGRADWGLPLWAWTTFSMWYAQFVEGKDAPPEPL